MGYMATQKGGLAGVGFNKKDLSNYIEHRMRSTIKDGDAMASLSYLPGKANNDQMFYAKYLISEDGKLMNLFWADVNSRIDYQCFRDMVVFDDMYKKNKYNKPMVIFLAKNHHSKIFTFGCELVAGEITNAYKWVLNTFLEVMCSKQPNSIVIDGDIAIREAIKEVFPNATHRLFQWHL